jgi:hypothetical protein
MSRELGHRWDNGAAMTRAQAEQECKRLAAEHPDRETHQWHPRQEADGAWAVVRIALPPPADLEIQAELQADEKPPTADDPRPAHYRNAGPWVGG